MAKDKADLVPHQGTSAAREPVAKDKEREPSCPTCGSPLAVYKPRPGPQGGTPFVHPHKSGTGWCQRCGVRHRLGQH
jgi:hypothetical protein